jgi:hypothetical protein
MWAARPSSPVTCAGPLALSAKLQSTPSLLACCHSNIQRAALPLLSFSFRCIVSRPQPLPPSHVHRCCCQPTQRCISCTPCMVRSVKAAATATHPLLLPPAPTCGSAAAMRTAAAARYACRWTTILPILSTTTSPHKQTQTQISAIRHQHVALLLSCAPVDVNLV